MRIGILGAGWLGSALAHFLKDNNQQVKVSTRSVAKQRQLQNQHLQTYLVQVKEDKIDGDLSFFESIDILVVSLIPQDLSIFKQVVCEVLKQNIPHVVVLSSTGIYNGCEGTVTESTLLKAENPKVALLQSIEALFLNHNGFTSTILRLGGLIGPNRHPVHYLVKKEVISNANEPVNILYQNTFLTTFSALLKAKMQHTIFNLVEKDHRTKEAFYTESSLKFGYKLPPFLATSSPKNRLVSTEKIEHFLSLKLNSD